MLGFGRAEEKRTRFYSFQFIFCNMDETIEPREREQNCILLTIPKEFIVSELNKQVNVFMVMGTRVLTVEDKIYK